MEPWQFCLLSVSDKQKPGENFNAAVEKMEKLKRDGFVKPMSADELTNFKETIHDQFKDNIVANLTSRFQDLLLIQRYNVFNATCLPDDEECVREYGNEEIKVLTEFKMILKTTDLSKVEERMTDCFEAVKKTIKKGADDEVAVLMHLEAEMRLKQGKGQKSQTIVTFVELADGPDVDSQLSSLPRSAPKLVCINSDGVTKDYAIVGDGINILLKTTKTTKAL